MSPYGTQNCLTSCRDFPYIETSSLSNDNSSKPSPEALKVYWCAENLPEAPLYREVQCRHSWRVSCRTKHCQFSIRPANGRVKIDCYKTLIQDVKRSLTFSTRQYIAFLIVTSMLISRLSRICWSISSLISMAVQNAHHQLHSLALPWIFSSFRKLSVAQTITVILKCHSSENFSGSHTLWPEIVVDL